MKPKVTVITPTHNRLHDLETAVRSVLNQTLTDWEMIVVNDGGRDAADLIESFNDPRLVYVSLEENRGKAACCNLALSRARGNHVAYLDDDDLWLPHHLEVLSRTLDEHPEAGAAYSDLYEVKFTRDPDDGRRFPLSKTLTFSRDFETEAIFRANFVLHVSLMHRREPAERVGGYDEALGSMIEWNLIRKLAAVTDFIHVPLITGEYWCSLGGSDRISDLSRRNMDSFKKNLRRVVTDLPPRPWPRIVDLALILPVSQWTSQVQVLIENLIDSILHPFEFILVDLTGSESGNPIRDRLEADLAHLTLLKPDRPLSVWEAYRLAAESTQAEYLHLASTDLDHNLDFRYFAAAEKIKESRPEALTWGKQAADKSRIDLLIRRDVFLSRVSRKADLERLPTQKIPARVPRGFEFETKFMEINDLYHKGRYGEALSGLEKAAEDDRNCYSQAFTANLFFPVLMKNKAFPRAEQLARSLCEQGYEGAFAVKLGLALQAQGRLEEAAAAYDRALSAIGLDESALMSPAFPVSYPHGELAAVSAAAGLGECLAGLGDRRTAAKVFGLAARISADSHRPHLGFGRLFLEEGRLDLAEKALVEAARKSNEDSEVFFQLGKLCQAKGMTDEAAEFFQRAEALSNPGSQPGASLEPGQKIGRNSPCPCGSGRKYKKCCLNKTS